MRRICERQNHKARSATAAKQLDFGAVKQQIRNARELVSLRRICERQNHKARSATAAKQLDFGAVKQQIRNAGEQNKWKNQRRNY